MLPGLLLGLDVCQPQDAPTRPGCFLSLVCHKSPVCGSQQPAHIWTLLGVWV